MKKITVVGIGPGETSDITTAAIDALRQADAVVGYKYYFQFVEKWLKSGCRKIETGMRHERERARQAFELAEEGLETVVISSGDANIYGMAPLLYEMKKERASDVELASVAGISAFQKAATLLGAPTGHDLCVISLSDLMTPWEKIERRIRAAAAGDFVTAIYNPRSHERYWQLYRLRELFLMEGRCDDTPVGIVRQAGRDQQTVKLTTLGTMNIDEVDMFCVLIIGNSQSYVWNGNMITPRGYYGEQEETNEKVGRSIMTESFRRIASELKRDYPADHKWALLHAIHTTADFSMEDILYSDPDAVNRMHSLAKEGTIKTIVTDVTMVCSGIRKGALERLGIAAKCYLNDTRAVELAQTTGITRSQAGIRIALEEHPDALFAFGNAPTALMELCDAITKGKAHPAGIVAAPVGFVHVCESKHMVKPFTDIPKLIVEGRKGGSNIAATLCNAILTMDDAAELRPGRDL